MENVDIIYWSLVSLKENQKEGETISDKEIYETFIHAQNQFSCFYFLKFRLSMLLKST